MELNYFVYLASQIELVVDRNGCLPNPHQAHFSRTTVTALSQMLWPVAETVILIAEPNSQIVDPRRFTLGGWTSRQ